MKNIFDIIKSNPLFEGIAYEDLAKMYDCLLARTVSYHKNDIILLTGSKIDTIGLVLSGRVKVKKEDIDGNSLILTELSSPELFGEVFACAGIDHSPVTIQAAQDCQILLMNYRRVITTCPSACPFHNRLIENMLALVAQKNLMLNQKIEILSRRTIREKLLGFLNLHKEKSTINKFTVPYNREEMADYLCVDRSALSKELSKLRDEGHIRFHKNEFEIL